MKKTILSLLAVAAFIIGFLGSSTVYGNPAISVGVALTDPAGNNPKDSFQVGEEVTVVLSLENVPDEDDPNDTGTDEITSDGFKERQFYLMLQFTGPDGELITAENLTGDDSPPPLSIPVIIGGQPVVLQAEEVEVVENGWAIKIERFNARDYYNLKVPGDYSVRAVVPLRTYPDFQTNQGKKIAELVDKDFEGFIASKSVPFSIEAMPGDYDYDADVDRDDLNMLLAYRNQPATEHPEYDLNGDGMITARDARKLMLLCTRPRCATE